MAFLERLWRRVKRRSKDKARDDTANCFQCATCTDGAEFESTLDTIEEVKTLHSQIERLSPHMGSLKC